MASRALLAALFLGCALVLRPGSCAPPPSGALQWLRPSSRVATYDDISTTFNLVYAVTDPCPSAVTFGEFTNDERQFPILPPEDIVEDDSQCSGDAPLNFVTELTVTEPGLLEALGLQSFQDAIGQNPNAATLITSEETEDLLVGWHNGTRTCGSVSYPTETIYFIIREDRDFRITFSRSDSSNRVTIPPDLRSLFIVAPGNQMCVLVDKSTNPEQDVSLLTLFSNGTETNSLLTTAGIVALPPVSETSSGGDDDGASDGADSAGDDTDTDTDTSEDSSDAASAASAAESADASAEPSVSASASPLPSASAVPTVADVVAPVEPSPSDFGILVASPSGDASPTPFITVLPAASAIAPGVGGITVEDDLDATSDEDDGSVCFPASAVVRSERGELRMHELQIGDRVQTGDGMSDVMLFSHRRRRGSFEFVRLTVRSGRQLTLSAGHYVYRRSGALVAAAAVAPGDELRMADGAEDGRVVRVEARVREMGLYNPQTLSGSVVVNGFVASTYTTAVEPRLAHGALLAPVRALHGVWRWPARRLSAALQHGSALARWLPRGQCQLHAP